MKTLAVFGRRMGPVLVKRALRRTVTGAETGHRLRLAFEDLGSTYVKFGQLVGSSPGAFTKAVSDEFRSCLDAGPAESFAHVRATVEGNLGRPLSAVFASFDETAIAAASIAVVHRAVLHDGRVVAVKVLRPGIAARVALDLDLMAPLFRRLALRGIAAAGPLYRFISGFRTQVAEELDLRNEARTMAHFRELLADSEIERIIIPEPYPEFSGPDVLTMEFLDGVPIDDVDAIADFGHDPKPVVRDMLNSWFLTGLRDGMFHGDIHAGNLMILRDGRAGAIDWGIVGRLDERTHHIFRRFVEAVLGDPTAWPEVLAFVREMAPFANPDGDGDDNDGESVAAATRRRDLPDEERREIEGILTRPFGEVDLTGAFSGPGGGRSGRAGRAPLTKAEKRERRQRLKEFRQRIIGTGFVETGFAQANFLLFKQLLYFERYGKMYLADEALMGDRAFLERVLAETASPISR